jgi:hypothetical protein
MATRTATPTVPTVPATPAAHEQLALLSPPELPIQFRLDQRTRERGLAHIAALRAQLAARAAARNTASSSRQAA